MSAADKIRAHTLAQEAKEGKTGPKIARARGREGEICVENTKNLQELLAPHLSKAIRAWVDGLKATKIAWSREIDGWVDTGFPDHKERRESGRAIVEYLVGKAIERSMEISGSYKELSQVLTELEKSPEARRLLPAEIFESLHKTCTVETASATVEGETTSQPQQNASNVQSAKQPHEEKDISDSDSEQKSG